MNELCAATGTQPLSGTACLACAASDYFKALSLSV